MIKTSDDPSDHMAYPSWHPYWDRNMVGGEYVIAYTFGPWLDQAVQSRLPEVYSKFQDSEKRLSLRRKEIS